MIFGSGTVGLSFTKCAKIFGMVPIILLDIVDEKREEAKKAKVDYAFNSTKVDPVAQVRKICKDGVDFSLDAMGINSLINTSMELIKDGGSICAYGIYPNLSMDLNWGKAPYNGNAKFEQFPNKVTEAATHDQIVNWIKLGVLKPKDYI